MDNDKALAPVKQPQTTPKKDEGTKFGPDIAKEARSNGKRGMTLELGAAIRIGGAQTIVFAGQEDGGGGAVGKPELSGRDIVIQFRAAATLGGDTTSAVDDFVARGAEDGGGGAVGQGEEESTNTRPGPTQAAQSYNTAQSASDAWPGTSVPARRDAGAKNVKTKK